MNKGQMMKLVYTEHELQNIDSALPMEYWKLVDVSVHVMNYNNNGPFGRLENMETEACARGIELHIQPKEIIDYD